MPWCQNSLSSLQLHTARATNIGHGGIWRLLQIPRCPMLTALVGPFPTSLISKHKAFAGPADATLPIEGSIKVATTFHRACGVLPAWRGSEAAFPPETLFAALQSLSAVE
mmetsp:Transcript_23026/g.53766  ORF Transcript_23026/g.53766 Transcript_23026/m.53766 type:complete len:110 (-) Transcript_23026:17-346(-)